jgi:cell division FtsZ-interacting protein ZapD
MIHSSRRQHTEPVMTLSAGARMRATVWPSVAGENAKFGVHFAQPDTEDKKLRKELTLEVPCFEGTLRKFLSE